MTTRHTGKNIKIFLSSTFRDMDAERDAIMNRVYPAVAQQLAPHNIHFDFIDLRWGVRTKQNVRTMCCASVLTAYRAHDRSSSVCSATDTDGCRLKRAGTPLWAA